MEIRILGPVEVRAQGEVISLGPVKQRTVMSALIMDIGRPVMIDTLINRVWDDSPPTEVRNVLYTYITRLRRILEHAERSSGHHIRLSRQSSGYVLDMDPSLVDLHRFERLMTESRLVDDDAERLFLQRTALDLWRGTPLADLSGSWLSRVREWMERGRMNALVEWADTGLRLGRPGPVIEDLGKVLAERPFAEPIIERLLLALSYSGRVVEALDLYAAARRRIVDVIGAEPGPALRRTYEAILREEIEMAPPSLPLLARDPN